MKLIIIFIISLLLVAVKKRKPTIIIPIGAAGSGKSTLYRRLKMKYPKIYLVSFDVLRKKLLNFDVTGKAFDERIEPNIQFRTYNLLKKFAGLGYDIFFDATNLTNAKRQQILDCIDLTKYRILYYYFDLPEELVLERNLKRKDRKGQAFVPEDIVKSQYNIMEKPEVDNIKSKIIYITN